MHGDFGNVWVQGCGTLRQEECVSGGRGGGVEAMGSWGFRGVAGSWGAFGFGDETVDCAGRARQASWTQVVGGERLGGEGHWLWV